MIILNKNDIVPRDYLVSTLKHSMKAGIAVTIPYEDMHAAEKRRLDALKILQDEFGIVNPNSNPQLSDFAMRSNDPIIQSCCFDSRKKKYSFSAENIAKLLEYDNRFGVILNRYKDATSLIKTIKQIEDAVDMQGFIHPAVSLQLTNRISYTNPALMNIDKRLLWKIVQPREAGWELWSVDVKNQEPWIFSHLIEDETLKTIVADAYVRKESFYKVVFEHIYGHPVDSEYEYSEFKMGWNMLTYGGTKQGLVARCKAIDGAKLYDFYSKLPGYKKYSAACYSKAAKRITKDTTYFGSTVESTATTTSQLARSLADIPIQGTAADILALLCKKITDNINDDAALRGRFLIYYTRHDEIIFMVKRNPGETDEDITAIFHNIADHMIDEWVPFMIDIEKVK